MNMPGSQSEDDSKTTKQFTAFGFNKKLPNKKLVDSRIRDDSTKNKEEERDYVLKVDSVKGIDSTKPKELPKELVIPCDGNKYKFHETHSIRSSKKNAQIQVKEELDVAAQELIQESKDWELRQQDEEEINKKNANLTVKLGQDNEELLFKQDVKSRADVSNLDDYDSIPVEGFGMGMLRGMGFKKEEGIGGFKKAAVKCIEPAVRPKGLGLGAAIPKKETKNTQKPGETEFLALVKGAYVFIEKGTSQDKYIDKCGTRYGQVDGLDEESARVIVKLALGGATLSLSENILRVVSKSEYKEYGKVVNKDQYKSHVERKKGRQIDGESNESENDRKNGRDRSRSPLHYKDRSDRSYTNGRCVKDGEPIWIQPQLKVRIIDKNYKGGKYYKIKAIVEDVVSSQNCVCRTLDNERIKVLENLPQSSFETVIPKDYGIIMVLSGKFKGQLGEVLSRNKSKARADIRLLEGEDLVKLDFDDICEFTGVIDMCS